MVDADSVFANSDLAGRLGDAAGLRNLLVHDYGDIDHARLWDTLGELDDLRSFAAAAERPPRAG